MIGRITGKAEDAGKGAILIETGGGVGYIVNTTAATKSTALTQKSCTLFTHTAIRKDTMELFGFPEQEEYAAFLLLLTVSGIGPKKALSLLETAPPATLLATIKNEDTETMVSLGIGRKQAQRIILDLQKKIETTEQTTTIPADVITALVALGYDKREIAETLKETALTGKTTEEQIKEALRAMLGKPAA